jgi:hypothetical protein
MPGAVMMDMTGWSSPIDTASQTERKTAQGLAVQGYATAQSHATSVAHAIWPLWYPLEYKRRSRPRWKRGARGIVEESSSEANSGPEERRVETYKIYIL